MPRIVDKIYKTSKICSFVFPTTLMYTRLSIASAAVALGILVPSIAAAHHYTEYSDSYRPTVSGADRYYADRQLANQYDDSTVKNYGGFEGLSHRYYTDPFYTTPYKTQTHALHPYYRNTYWTRRGRTYRFSNPLFHQYLEDLYYEGYLTGGDPHSYDPPRYAPEHSGCYNYNAKRTSYRSPARVTDCF